MLLDLPTILSMWEKDSVIPQHQLDEVSRTTPNLHAKYLAQLALAKLQLKREENKQKSLLKLKWEYYNGKMDPDTLNSVGWVPDPFNGLKILKGDMDYYYDADPEIQSSEEKLVEELDQIVEDLTIHRAKIESIVSKYNITPK